MTTWVLVLMLSRAGAAGDGSAATMTQIPGFNSITACEEARDKWLRYPPTGFAARATCLEVH